MNGITVLACIAGYDIWFYCSHVLLHQPILYKTIHYIHHDVGPFQGLGLVLPFVFSQWDPYSCLAALVFVNVRGMMRHDHRCSWLIGDHHLLNHKYPRTNYGEKWLDKLFGTLRKPKQTIEETEDTRC